MFFLSGTTELTMSEAIESVTETVLATGHAPASDALSTMLDAADRRIEAIEDAMEFVLDAAMAGNSKARRVYLQMRAALGDQGSPRTLPHALPEFDHAA